MFASSTKEQKKALDSKVDSFFDKEPLSEEISDFSDFAEYRKICVPIRCGSRTGLICTYLHKDHMDSSLDPFYLSGFQNLIEYKKYIESERLNFDVGPVYAIASAIEDGDYFSLLKDFQERWKLKEFEHAFHVREDGDSYHILPSTCDTAFGNTEQLGLIRFSIYKAFGGNAFIGNRSDLNKLIAEWIASNNSQNSRKLREILDSAKCKKVKNIDREFSKCILYLNLFNRLKTEIQLDSLVEKLKMLEK